MPPAIEVTAKETEILVSVVSLLGEIPDVDFDTVAGMIGVKYGRNARTSFKKLFDRLHAIHTTAADMATTSGGSDAHAGADEAPAKSAKTAAPKRVARKPSVPKKTVGKQIAPKKAVAKKPTAESNCPRNKATIDEEAGATHQAHEAEDKDESTEENHTAGKSTLTLAFANGNLA